MATRENEDLQNNSLITTTYKRNSGGKFSFTYFDNKSEGWKYYLQRFELEVKLNNLDDDYDLKRNLLLKWIGPEAYKLTVDNFDPRPVMEVNYDDIITFLTGYFQLPTHFLSERVKFMSISKQSDQTVKQYVSNLRAAAHNCKFGPNLDERLRDQFLLGLNNTNMQEELFRRFPNTDSKFVDVEKEALIIENAQQQRDFLNHNNNLNNVNKVVDSRRSKFINSFSKKGSWNRNKQSRVLGTNDDKECHATTKNGNNSMCFRCGKEWHAKDNNCPAISSKCHACGLTGHWSTMCIKSGIFNPAKKVLKPLKREANKVEETIYDEQDAQSDDGGYIHMVRQGEHGKYVIDVYMNNMKVRMEYDTAASRTLIGRTIWTKIGRPQLFPTPSLVAYPNFDIPMLGETTVSVRIGNTTKEVLIAVTRDDGMPLLGKDLIYSFNLQPQCDFVSYSVNNISSSKNNSSDRDVNNSGLKDISFNRNMSDKVTKKIISEFADVLSDSAGLVNNFEVKINIKNGAKLTIHKPRPVPFALKKAADTEIQRLLDQNIIELIDPTENIVEFASPVVYVAKPNGSVRLCGDFRELNKYLQPDPHPIPTFEDVVSKLNGFNTFSVIDLKDAYLQLPLHSESQRFLVIATHKGYFKYKRMPFGISPASQIFQRYIDSLLSDIEGVTWFVDDICTGGRTEEEHVLRLEQIFRRFRSVGLKTQLNKLHLMCNEIKFLGHTITKDGIHPTKERIQAIKEQPVPKNVSELRSFLGSLNYYSRFIPNLQLMCSPLHRLLKKGARWQWTESDNKLYQTLKNSISSENTLVHYDPILPLILATDASDYGVAAIIMHTCKDGINRPIAAASRTLSSCEKKYAVIDKEALAIIFGVNKFYQFIYGRHFTILCDHKPLERIFGNKRELPKFAASRLLRWCLTLSAFDYEIQYVPGSSNVAADSLSRLPLPSTQASDFEKKDAMVVCQITDLVLDELPLTRSVLRKRTQSDEPTRTIITYIERGWPEKKHIPEDLLVFYEKRHEISFEENILMWQNRIIIPRSLRKQVLDQIHEGHHGVVAMKSLARLSVWWPNIDNDIERKVKNCLPCQTHRKREPETPLNLWNIPDGPWERVHMDFLGPFEGKMWLMVIDSYSRWLNVFPMVQATTEKVIQNLRSLFSQYGIFRKLVTDNGSQFTSREFKAFIKANNITHIRSSPYHSRTNGMAERVIQTFQYHYLAARNDFVNPTHRLQSILFAYRTRIHSATLRSPAELFLNRKLNTKLDLLKPNVRSNMDTAQFKQKSYHDLHSKERQFEQQQQVWVKKDFNSKWQPGRIAQRTGPLSYTVDIEGRNDVRQHADHLRPRPTLEADQSENFNNSSEDNSNISTEQSTQATTPLCTMVGEPSESHQTWSLRPKRQTQKPRHIMRDDFIFYK